METLLKKAVPCKTKVGGTHQGYFPLVNFMHWVILSLIFHLLSLYSGNILLLFQRSKEGVALLRFSVGLFKNRFTESIRRTEDK